MYLNSTKCHLLWTKKGVRVVLCDISQFSPANSISISILWTLYCTSLDVFARDWDSISCRTKTESITNSPFILNFSNVANAISWKANKLLKVLSGNFNVQITFRIFGTISRWTTDWKWITSRRSKLYNERTVATMTGFMIFQACIST